MAAFGYSAGTFLALIIFLITISSPHSTAAPVYEDDLKTQQSQVAEYFGDESTSCYYNFQHYEEGDRIITNEPCLNCTCHKRMLMCYLRVCPFTKAIGQDCKVEKRPDQCCPVITCPEVPVQLLTSSTTPEPTTSSNAVGHLDNHGCTLGDSTFYPDGAQVPQDPKKPCELCYCIRNRTACVMQECTLNVEGCRPVYQDGVCCPVRYDCDYDEAPTTERINTGGLILTTTPNPLGCGYNNEMYNDGELIVTKTQKPCEHCYCMRGDIVCAVRSCGTPLQGKDCKPVEPPKGECCPITYECANGTVPLDSMSLVTDKTYALKPEDSSLNKPADSSLNKPEDSSLDKPEDSALDKLEDSALDKPEKKPETESVEDSQETEKNKLHDTVLNNQQAIETSVLSLFENDEIEKHEKSPAVDSSEDKKEPELPALETSDKKESESPALETSDKTESDSPALETSDKKESDSPTLETSNEKESDSPALETSDKKESESPVVETSDKKESESPALDTSDKKESESPEVETSDKKESESPTVENNESDKKESESTKTPDKLDSESKPQEPDSLDKVSQSQDNLEVQLPASSDAVESDFQDESESDVSPVDPAPSQHQDEVQSGDNINAPSVQNQETPNSIPEGITPVHDDEGIQQIHVGQLDDTLVTEKPPQEDVNLITAAPKPQDVSEVVESDKKPSDTTITDETKPSLDENLQSEPNASGVESSTTNVQQTPDEVSAVNKPVEETTNKDVELTHAGHPEADVSETVKESEESSNDKEKDKPQDSVSDNVTNKPEDTKAGQESEVKDTVVQTTGEIGTNEIVKDSQVGEDQPQEKPNTNQIESENKPDESAQVQPNNESPLQTGTQETDQVQQTPEDTESSEEENHPITGENKPVETLNHAESDKNKQQDSETKEPSSEEDKSQEADKDTNTKEHSSEEDKSEESDKEKNTDTKESSSETDKPQETNKEEDTIKPTSVEDKPQDFDKEKDTDTNESINEEDKSQEDTTGSSSPEIKPHDSVNIASDDTSEDKETVSGESDKNKEQELEHHETLQPAADDLETKPDSTPVETNHEENKPQNVDEDESILSENEPHPTELDKPKEKPQGSVTDETSNGVSKPQEPEQINISEQIPNEIEGKPQETEESTEAQNKPFDTNKPDENKLQDHVESDNIQTGEAETKPLDTVGSGNKVESGSDVNVSENDNTGETEVKPSVVNEGNILISTSGVGNQVLEHDNSQPSIESDTPVNVPDGSLAVGQDGTVTPQVQTPEESLDSETKHDAKPNKDAIIPSVAVESDVKPAEDTKPSDEQIVQDKEDNKPVLTISSESIETQNSQETITPPKESNQSEEQPVVESENIKPIVTDEIIKPQDELPVQSDDIEQPQSPVPTVVLEDTAKPEEEKQSGEPDLGSEANIKEPVIVEKVSETVTESKPLEESSTAPSNEVADSQSADGTPQVSVQSPAPAESTDASNDGNKLPESIPSVAQDTVDENTPTESILSLVEESSSTSEPSSSDNTAQKQTDNIEIPNNTVSSSTDNKEKDENQQTPANSDENSKNPETNKLSPEKATPSIETGSNDNVINQEKPEQPDVSEDNKPEVPLPDKQEENTSETSLSESEKPTELNESAVPVNEEVIVPTVSNSDKPIDNKQEESPSNVDTPQEQTISDNSGTVDETNINNLPTQVLHDEIETSESDEDEEPLIPESSPVTDKTVQTVESNKETEPSQQVEEGNKETDKPSQQTEEANKEEPKPEEQTPTNDKTPSQSDLHTSNTKLEISTDNSQALDGESSQANKPEDQKQSSDGEKLPEKSEDSPDEKVQDVQTQITTEIKHDNEDKMQETHTIESTTTNEISSDHKITYVTEGGHGGIIHDLKETFKPNLPGPAGVQDHGGIPGEGSCLVDGKTYYNNSNVPSSNMCHRECKCISSVVHCFGIPCSPPPTDMLNCMPIKQGDACCPSYACDANVTPVSLEAQNQMGNEEKPELELSEQKPESVDAAPTPSIEPNKPEQDTKVNQEEENTPQLPVVPEVVQTSVFPIQPSVSSDAQPNIVQDEVNVNNIAIVHSDGLPETAEEEEIVSGNVAPIDDSKPHTSHSALPSDAANSSDNVPSTDNEQPSDNVLPSSLPEETPSVESDNVNPSINVQSSNTKEQFDIVHAQTPSVEPLPTSDESNVPSSDTKLSGTEQDEKLNTSEGITTESSSNSIPDKEAIPEKSHSTKPETVEEQNPITPTEASVVENPADGQNIEQDSNVNEPTDSVAGHITPEKTSTGVEPQHSDGEINYSDTHVEVVPQQKPASDVEQHPDSEEPSVTTSPNDDEQTSVETPTAEQQPKIPAKQGVISEPSPQENPISSVVPDQPNVELDHSLVTEVPVEGQESISSKPASTVNDETAVDETEEENQPTIINIADDIPVHADGFEPESSDLEHLPPVFEIIEPNVQEKPVDDPNKAAEVDEHPATTTKEESVTITPLSNDKEQNVIDGSAESVNTTKETDQPQPEEPNKAVESSDEQSLTISGTPEDIATITPLSDNKEPNIIDEPIETVNVEKDSSPVKPDEPNKVGEPTLVNSSAVPASPEESATISPLSDNKEPSIVQEPIESVQPVEESVHKDPINDEKTSEIPNSPELSPTNIPVLSSDSKEPSTDVPVESVNTVHESSVSGSNDPEKGTYSTSVSEVNTEIPQKKSDKIVPSQPSSVNINEDSKPVGEESTADNVDKPIVSDEIVTNSPISETSVTETPSQSTSNEQVSQDEKDIHSDQDLTKPEINNVLDTSSPNLSENTESAQPNQPLENNVDVPQITHGDNELPIVPNIDSTNIMDQKTESPEVLGTSDSEQPLAPAEEVTSQTLIEGDHPQTSNSVAPSQPDISTNVEIEQPTNVEHDDKKPLSDEIATVASVELPDKSDVSESTTDQESEKESISTDKNKETKQPINEVNPTQSGIEEGELPISQQNTLVKTDSTLEETKPEGQGSPSNVGITEAPAADEIESQHNSEPSTDIASAISTEEVNQPLIPESDNFVTKAPELLNEKDETISTVTESVQTVESGDPVSPNIPTKDVSSDNEANKVVPTVQFDSSPAEESGPSVSETDLNTQGPITVNDLTVPEVVIPSVVVESDLSNTDLNSGSDDSTDKTETSPEHINIDALSTTQETKPSESEVVTPVETVPSESDATNVGASEPSSGESDTPVNTETETIVAESIGEENPLPQPAVPDTSVTSDAVPDEEIPSTLAEVDQTPSQTPLEKDTNEKPIGSEISESSPTVQEEPSSSEPSTSDENTVTETAQVPQQTETDYKPQLHQTVIAETSSVHASSSPKLPETEEDKPESPTDELTQDVDKIIFPEVTDDSIQTNAPPSLISQEALNELASGQQLTPQKPALPHLPGYYPGGDSSFGPLPMPGWTPKPYLPETSSEESNTDEEEEHPSEGDMDYGGSEDGAFGPGTCRYGGKVYVSAQQIPRDDPCDFCFCFRSDIICLQQSCPPPIHRCRQESIKGFCCPRYECPVSMATTLNITTTTTTTTTTLPPHFFAHAYKGAARRTGCHVRGISYLVGDEIKSASGPCLQCICGADGQMQCDPKICSPEPMLRKMMEAAVSRRRR